MRGRVKKQDNRRFAVGRLPFRKTRRLHIDRVEWDCELFPDFADKRFPWIFIGFHLAAGKFPQARMVLSLRPLLHQQPPFPVPRRESDHKHACRISCQLTNPSQPIVSNCLRKSTGQIELGVRPMRMVAFMKKVLSDEQGATAVEYGLIVSLIVIAMIGALKGVANENTGLWATVSKNVMKYM